MPQHRFVVGPGGTRNTTSPDLGNMSHEIPIAQGHNLRACSSTSSVLYLEEERDGEKIRKENENDDKGRDNLSHPHKTKSREENNKGADTPRFHFTNTPASPASALGAEKREDNNAGLHGKKEEKRERITASIIITASDEKEEKEEPRAPAKEKVKEEEEEDTFMDTFYVPPGVEAYHSGGHLGDTSKLQASSPGSHPTGNASAFPMPRPAVTMRVEIPDLVRNPQEREKQKLAIAEMKRTFRETGQKFLPVQPFKVLPPLLPREASNTGGTSEHQASLKEPWKRRKPWARSKQTPRKPQDYFDTGFRRKTELSQGASTIRTSMAATEPMAFGSRDSGRDSARKSKIESASTLDSVATMATVDLQHISQRTHMNDVSYLKDQPRFLTPRIPETEIPKEDFVVEKLFFPSDRGSIYNKEDGMWHRTLFPSAEPQGRMDAIYLDKWLVYAIKEYAKTSNGKPLADQVCDIVGLLKKAMHEIIRMSLLSCEERGRLLEQVWNAYVNLFDFVLKEMQNTLLVYKRKAKDAEEALVIESEECEEIHVRHPKELKNLLQDLEQNFSIESAKVTELMNEANELSKSLMAEIDELNMLLKAKFPHSSKRLKELLLLDLGENDVESEDPMELLASDLQRIVAALKPKDRAYIGQFLGHKFSDDPEADEHRILSMTEDIAAQEALIKELRKKR